MVLAYAGPGALDAPGARIGGVPLAPPSYVWPVCSTCSGAMQFIAQVPLPDDPGDRHLLMFKCDNDPGMCDEWSATSGGTHAAVVTGTAPLAAPSIGRTALDAVYLLQAVDAGPIGYLAALDGAHGRVLGQVRGTPEWIQGEEVPDCPDCATPMSFAVQLEPGLDGEINFGDTGSGYGFTCPTCSRAAFLFQSC